MFGENDIVHCKDTVIALFNFVPVRTRSLKDKTPPPDALAPGGGTGGAAGETTDRPFSRSPRGFSRPCVRWS